MMPLMKTFSRPEISGWKPAPSSISAEMRPFTGRAASSACVMPATHLSIVLLPEPFRPMIAKVDPAGTSKDTPFSAANVSSGLQVLIRLPESSALFSVANCFRCV